MPAALRRLNQPSSRCLGTGCVTRSSLKSGNTAFMTSVEESSPRPTAASTSSTSLRASRCSTGFRLSFAKVFPARSKARSSMRTPRPEYCLRMAFLVARRMAARALPVTTIDSHAAGGTCAFDLMISTSSPFFNSVINGMMRPLTLAPTQVSPTSVWTA